MATDDPLTEPGQPEIPRNRAIGVASFFTVLVGLEALFFVSLIRGGWMPLLLVLGGLASVILIWLTAGRTGSRSAVALVGIGLFLLIPFSLFVIVLHALAQDHS